jgi:hypothetical protein
MKFAICYKGVFNINYIKQKGVDDNLLNIVNNTILNHKAMIYSDLIEVGNEVDTFISSYNLDNRLNDLLLRGYDAKGYIFFDKNQLNSGTWAAQLNHHKFLIDLIKTEERNNNFNYDYLIFTRFDIDFHKNYNTFNLELDKLNITVEHPSGNCDDNLWIFPRNYLDIFENSVDALIAENKMTHELNHKIIKFGGQINYIDKLIDSYMGHTIFSFIR